MFVNSNKNGSVVGQEEDALGEPADDVDLAGSPCDEPAGGAVLNSSDEEFFRGAGSAASSDVGSSEGPGSEDGPESATGIDILDDDRFVPGDADPTAPTDDAVPAVEYAKPLPAGSGMGASSSSSSAPPLPPPAALPPVSDDEGEQIRGRASVFFVEGGKLSYYTDKKFMTATCCNPKHGKCVLTRIARVGPQGHDGRPLGLFLAWLAKGSACETKAEHWKSSTWPTLEERLAARETFALEDHPDARRMRKAERKQRDGEGVEPILIPPPTKQGL